MSDPNDMCRTMYFSCYIVVSLSTLFSLRFHTHDGTSAINFGNIHRGTALVGVLVSRFTYTFKAWKAIFHSAILSALNATSALHMCSTGEDRSPAAAPLRSAARSDVAVEAAVEAGERPRGQAAQAEHRGEGCGASRRRCASRWDRGESW